MDVFIKGYLKELEQSFKKLDLKKIEKIKDIFHDCHGTHRQIFVFGNGGSATTASHMACDLSKGILGHQGDKEIARFKILSLNDNISLMSAWSNDVSYDRIFAEQIKNFIKADDVAVGISASGNSKNILEAIEVAKKQGATTIGLVGFGGGKLLDIADHCLVVESNRYDVTEDMHLIFSHMLTRWFYENL